jgi:hypothetical protein
MPCWTWPSSWPASSWSITHCRTRRRWTHPTAVLPSPSAREPRTQIGTVSTTILEPGIGRKWSCRTAGPNPRSRPTSLIVALLLRVWELERLLGELELQVQRQCYDRSCRRWDARPTHVAYRRNHCAHASAQLPTTGIVVEPESIAPPAAVGLVGRRRRTPQDEQSFGSAMGSEPWLPPSPAVRDPVSPPLSLLAGRPTVQPRRYPGRPRPRVPARAR